uniref:uncharacterized protein LOC122583633 n=1 Tax=Erigeron canadensis TaxID=72917 RepID=UPI001CB9A9C3|nr:uncharacterized protein LOC122583633 [Erigeron canadensis]
MALFKVQCTACKVLDHLTLLAKESSLTASPSPSNAEWLRLDAIVLQWIYNTITPNLWTTILDPNNTAAQVWAALAHSNLVLQLIAGLSVEYDTVAIALQQAATLPTFESTRSRLVLEEGRKACQAASANLTATTYHPAPNLPAPPTPVQNLFYQLPIDPQPQNIQGRGYDYRGSQAGGRRGGRGRGNNGIPTLVTLATYLNGNNVSSSMVDSTMPLSYSSP